MAAAMTFAEAIDVIEETYEFMLAYAAQGRRRDDDDQGSGIRDRLTRVEAALGIIISATAEAIATGRAGRGGRPSSSMSSRPMRRGRARRSAWCWRSPRSDRRSSIISTPRPMCARC